MATEFKLTANPPVALEDFGKAVAVGLDTAVVGAPTTGIGPGAAYVFVQSGSGWTQQIRVSASDETWRDAFGAAVAIDEDALVVGAPEGGDEDHGRAYVFHRSGSLWSGQGLLLVASDTTPHGSFGRSVSISGDYIIVGADHAAYVFHRDGADWTEQVKLIAPDSISNTYSFGCSVSISGVYAVVGAYSGGGNAEGVVFVFRRTGATWEFQAPLLKATNPVAGDWFGWSVSISGDYLVVGAPRASSGGAEQAGAAYLFERNGSSWLPVSKLEPSDPHVVKQFGETVAIINGYALVGDSNDYDIGPGSGAAYLFKRMGAGWSMLGTKIIASDAVESDHFGVSVALSAAHILVGAPTHEDGVPYQGAAYAYPLPPNIPKKIGAEYAIFAKILVGLTGGGGGIIILPGTGPIPVDPEPFRTWKSLPVSKRDLLIGLALSEIAPMINDTTTQELIQRAGADLTRKAAASLTGSGRA